MSSTIGDNIKISVFGESHGKAIGVVIDGLPSGLKLDMDKILLEMKRRAPGNDKTATPRKEADFPEILSGVVDNTITGAPLCAIIYNTNTKSKDYSNIKRCPRPGHSDYPAYIKYNGFNDIAGGGHFSGRITAPIVFAGAVCKQILLEKGIKVTAHINSIGNVDDKSFDPCNISDETIDRLLNSSFPLLDSSKEEEMRKEVADSAFNKDS
ncbi:MAG: chorismate synthase, partial [Ruminococcus sp.]|nr:chorismate synthase [Ruminococcus sp.]